MSDRYRDKRVLCADNGLFGHFARKLSESFGHVDYWTPSVNAFPKSNLALPGEGIEGIHRVIDFWPAARKADLIVFTDVMFGDMQEQCEMMGKPVYGSRYGEMLELKRWYFKKVLINLNMPVAETHLITGIAQLRRFLQEHEGYWIKTSRFRGDFETFQATSYEEVKPRLQQLESAEELGEKASIYPFIVEKNIPAVLEVGYDGDTIRGKFPEDDDIAIFGIEQKDLGYVGISKPYGDLPEPVRWANRMLSGILRQHGYAGLYSTELRVQNGDEVPQSPPKRFEDCPMLWNYGEPVPGTDFFCFYTDACCRAASPPSELYVEWIDNWAEKMWRGARGEFVANRVVSKYGIEIMLHSSWADKHWQPVTFPDHIQRYVKLRNHCLLNDVNYAVPQSVGLPEIGAVIGLGDTLPDAILRGLMVSNQVGGFYVDPKMEAITKTIENIRSAQEEGLEFTDDDLPTPDDIEALQAEAIEATESPTKKLANRRRFSMDPRQPYQPQGVGGGGGWLPVPIPPPPPVPPGDPITDAGGDIVLDAGGEMFTGADGGV